MGRARRNLSNGPKDYHEIGQRHLKHQKARGLLQAGFRAVCSSQGKSQEGLLEELALETRLQALQN